MAVHSFIALLATVGAVMLMDVCQSIDPVNVMLVDSDDQLNLCAEKNWCEATGFMDDLNYKCWVTSYKLCAGVRRVGDKSICRHSVSNDVVKCHAGEWRRTRQETLLKKRVKRWLWGGGSSTRYVVQYVPDNPPSISCPSDVTRRASSGQKTAAVSWSQATASDDRGVSSVTQISGPSSGSLFNEGSTVIGYRATDTAGQTAQCQFTVTVYVTRCPSMPSFSHGTRSCNGAEGNLYGSTCSHSCNTGYRLQGVSSISCQVSSTWNSPFPSCQPVSCGDPGQVSGGQIECLHGHVYPQYCLIQCNSGFQHSGSTSVSCSANGIWSNKDPCTDVEAPRFTGGCPPNQDLFSGPLKAPVAVTWVDPVVTDNGGQSTLTSVPAKGSTLGPGLYTVNITATDVVGNAASCQIAVTITARECPKPVTPSNGNVTCTMDHVEGSECTVSCNHGYRLQGQATLTCLHTELWDVAFPTCQAVVCPVPSSVDDGHFYCPNGRQCPAVCNLTCNAGFKVADPGHIQCQQSGTWSPAGSCQDIQAPVFDSGCPSNMDVYAARLGQQTIVNWTAPAVSDNSGDVINVTSDVRPGIAFPVGTTVVTYTASDVSGNENTCYTNVTVTVLQCGAQNLQPAHANGSSPLQEACPDGFVHGATCTLSCAHGYRLQGRSAITCERDDSTHPPTMTWEWAGPLSVKPQCKADLCPELSPPDHGALSCLLGDDGWHCYMSCDSDWDVPVGFDGRLVCYNQERIWRPSPTPDCTDRKLPHRVRAMGDLLYFTGSCNASVERFQQTFMSIIDQSIYKTSCAALLPCVAENVEVTCGTVPPRSKRHADADEDKLMTRLHRARRHATNEPMSHYVYVTFHVTTLYQEGTESPEEAYQNFKTKATNLVTDLKSRALTGQLNVEGLVADDFTVGYAKLGADCPPGTVYRSTRPQTRFSCVATDTP